jgi:tripartite ATP-independent transporter DctM subunit
MQAAFIILLGGLVFFMALGIPIAFSMGITSVIYFLYDQGLGFSYQVVAQRMFYGVNNFTLLAVPFFIFAANLMNTGGITRRLFKFADILVGHLPGGLGQVNIIASVIFAGMSGSATSDAAGLGTIELEAMLNAGYDKEFAVAITAASSLIGPIIPPSVPLVLYGVSAGASVGALLLGGIIPGLLMAATLMIMVALYALRRDYLIRKRPTLMEIWVSFRDAFPPLVTPVIIIGGIFWGWFTPTEASVVAAAYAMFLATVLYRELSLADIYKQIDSTCRTTTTVILIASAANIYGWLLLRSGIPTYVAELIPKLASTQLGCLFLIVLFLLFAGCFMEPISAIMILCPILVPFVESIGVDTIHFGLIMVLSLMIGLLTPPVGMVLYVMQVIADMPFDQVVKAVIPFLVPLVITLVLLVIFPDLVTFVPRMAMGY